MYGPGQNTREYRIAFMVPILHLIGISSSLVMFPAVKSGGFCAMAQGVEMPGAKAHNEILGQFHLSLSHDEVHNTLCGMHWRQKV